MLGENYYRRRRRFVMDIMYYSNTGLGEYRNTGIQEYRNMGKSLHIVSSDEVYPKRGEVYLMFTLGIPGVEGDKFTL